MITYTTKIDKALSVAAWAHAQHNQHRKGTDIPYIMHPVAVMLIANSVTTDEDTLIACLLHDILEDVSPKFYSEEQMRQDFGDQVVAIVKDVTSDATITTWQERTQAYLDHIEKSASSQALIVCGADKIHNLFSMIKEYHEQGSEIWQRFEGKTPSNQLWRYQSIVQILIKRQAPLTLINQLAKLIEELKAIVTTSE